MSDLASQQGIESWLRRLGPRIESIERSVGRGRIPRACTSTTRPRPGALQPGVRVFEMDTNRSVFVNAAQSGYVDAMGNAV